MDKQQAFIGKLEKLKKRAARSNDLIQKRMDELDLAYHEILNETERTAMEARETFENEEERLKHELDQAGKDYTQKKYILERDASNARSDIQKAESDYHAIQKNIEHEINRINEEKTNLHVSHEKQKSALIDMYQEQRRHLILTKEKATHQWARIEGRLKETKLKTADELTKMKAEFDGRLEILRDQVKSKKQGWQIALDSIQRTYAALDAERNEIEKKLSTVREEKEAELNAVQIAMRVAKEKLDLDKASLIQQAEVDKKQCEEDVRALEEKILKAEQEMQNLIVAQEQRKKDTEEVFQREEEALKAAVKSETEKRDFEQKMFEREKLEKEKTINRLRDEYDKKKEHWEAQIRNLLMQKSVQETQFESERMRVDREARVIFRNLEAKRDELKQRLAELKARYDQLTVNAEKEKELLNQRWQWRKERLWSMWKSRIEAIKEDRLILGEQLTHLMESFGKEESKAKDEEVRAEARVDELQQFVINITEKNNGQRKQREIQLELEKTRFIAQIKECEALLVDWMDRIKMTQDQVDGDTKGFAAQMEFLERLFRDEQKETELFLHDLRKVLNFQESRENAA